VQDIADFAGIGKATIYLYFSSKEEILHECMEEFALNSNKNLQSYIYNIQKLDSSSLSVDNFELDAFIDEYINDALYKQEKLYIALLNFFDLIEVKEKGIEGIKNKYQELSEPIIEYGKALIKKYKHSGIIKKDVDEDKLIYTLSFLLLGFTFRSIMVDDDKIKMMGESLKEIIHDLFFKNE
jgi:AcrR family transcriptional regulator